MKYEGEGKEQVRAWVNGEGVEKVLTDFAEKMEIEKADLEKDTLSAEIIDKWVKWVEKEWEEKDKNWEEAREVLYDSRGVLYDFVEDTQENLNDASSYDYREITDSYKKFLIYKYKKNKPNWSVLDKIEDNTYKENAKQKAEQFQNEADKYQIKDPDLSSNLLQKVYELLWKELPGQTFIKGQESWISSDTMTSAMARFTDAMQKIIPDKDESLENKEVVKKIEEIYAACTVDHRQKWWSTNFSIIVEAVLFEEEEFYKIIDEKYPSMKQFLDLCHTIGNYCPVPIGFNTARSSGCAKYDYWDLTLEQIYQWYKYDEKKKTEKKDPLVKLLHMDKLLGNCTEWLRWFEQAENKKDEKYDGWHNFVDTLFLQDYVDIKDNYKPVPFWDGHSWDNSNLPGDETAVNEALQEINKRIIARSLRIVAACRKKLAEQESES